MREESQAPLQSAEFDALAQMLGSAGLPLESGHLLDKAFDGQPLSMLRVGRAGGPVIAEMRGGRYSEPSKLTVGQFFETWLSHVKPQVTPRTTSAIVNSFGKTSFPQSARSV